MIRFLFEISFTSAEIIASAAERETSAIYFIDRKLLC